jgi:DNA helicase II / ATP-dependent DNA helicase PcrA
MGFDEINSKIYGDATKDQISAIDHIGSHARLLAGPGTGKTKTLTRRVLSLVLRHNVKPETILLITFTRLAAAQLRDEIKKVLEPLNIGIPHISTLHSFALRQILHNSSRIDTLPRPVRIADDWEERNIIQEDLKKILSSRDIGEIQKLINQLSTDWETLRVDEEGWEQQFPNAAFLGAWRAHKAIYGETLRAELVYQLKRQLAQNREFILDKEYEYVLIDEYQDLNACDLAIVHELSQRKAELFVTGDDDQSIYGFRYAYPFGIRQFPEIYQNTKRLALEICFRCDKNILKLAEFVANLDTARLPKPTKPRLDAVDGEVFIINFRDQLHEAECIANKIKDMIDGGISPGKITVLLRNDHNGALSKPLLDALGLKGVSVYLAAESELDNDYSYRVVLSMLRLIVNPEDNLAMRTLLQVEKSGIGAEGIYAIWLYAQKHDKRFSMALKEIQANPTATPRFGPKIAKFMTELSARLDQFKSSQNLGETIIDIMNSVPMSDEIKQKIKGHLERIIIEQNITQLSDLIKTFEVSSEQIEQETKDNAVNILTMHQAKGLTFDVCFIVGVEDEFIPGRNTGEREGDERRLLYVSMTRAKHSLYITYCAKRINQQRYLGRNSGDSRRTLTRFLKDSPIKIIIAK